MVKELSFENLPFIPEEGQVIYVEQSYHEKLNKFIRNNYVWLKKTFKRHNLEFCYMPLQAEETVAYFAPYLSDEEVRKKVGQVAPLSDYVIGDKVIEPSLLFAVENLKADASNNPILLSVTINTRWFVPKKCVFAHLTKEIEQAVKEHRCPTRITENDTEGKIRFSIGTPEEDEIRFSVSDPDKADNNFDSQSLILIDEIKERIETLRNRGINTMFLHELIDESEHLSRLLITKDYRIYLLDYNNMEIKLPVLPKAVFLLFLQHPEGIRFKELTDYYSELLQIYLKMNPIGDRKRQEQSISDVTDPTNNSINEKCARIREAFIRNFDDRLAKNYYITGKRGEAKRITLNESMIIWE